MTKEPPPERTVLPFAVAGTFSENPAPRDGRTALPFERSRPLTADPTTRDKGTALPFARSRLLAKSKHPSRRGELKGLIRQCEAADLSAGARMVLCVLWTYANEDGLTWPGNERIERESGLPESTARRALSELEASGIMRSVRAAKGAPRIKLGAVEFARNKRLYLLWPISTARGRTFFAEQVSPKLRGHDAKGRVWRVRAVAGDATAEPMPTATLLEQLQAGRIAPTALVQSEGIGWTHAMDVPALAHACAWPHRLPGSELTSATG